MTHRNSYRATRRREIRSIVFLPSRAKRIDARARDL
jgi:hypothetical protein